MKKKRLYIGLLIVCFNGPDGRITEPLPLIEMAESQEEIKQKAKEYLLSNYPVSAGWYGHCARIAPWSKDCLDNLLSNFHNGSLDLAEPKESMMDYWFDRRVNRPETEISEKEWPDFLQ